MRSLMEGWKELAEQQANRIEALEAALRKIIVFVDSAASIEWTDIDRIGEIARATLDQDAGCGKSVIEPWVLK